MDFEIVGPIRAVETLAVGRAIRELRQLRRRLMKIKFPLLD